ncbi:MAG: hypothetical protein AAFO89_04590, partial [Planctomycetota bacterium]
SVLESRGEVMDREYSDDGDAVLRICIGDRLLKQLRASTPALRVVAGDTPQQTAMGWKQPGESSTP